MHLVSILQSVTRQLARSAVSWVLDYQVSWQLIYWIIRASKESAIDIFTWSNGYISEEPDDILFQVKTFLYEKLLIAVVSATE